MNFAVDYHMPFYEYLKKIAFKLDPEKVHDLSIELMHKKLIPLALIKRDQSKCNTQLIINKLNWNFPVGLAAGFDKNALAADFLLNLGFGSVEVGTITLKEQKGNKKPRIFRHPEIESLQNSMGFPNLGLAKIKKNITNLNESKTKIGINIGKNKNTSVQDTPQEYAQLYKELAPFAQYIAVNISSPNTPNLRSFQNAQMITPILDAIKMEQQKIKTPVFLKLSPDMQKEDIIDLCELSKKYQLAGIIATNTTTQHNFGNGGLSGKYIKEISQNTRKDICKILKEDPTQTIIGVGAISSFQDIRTFWQQGGSFVQIYTSFIYEGPYILSKIQNEIYLEMEKYGVATVQELYQLIRNEKNI